MMRFLLTACLLLVPMSSWAVEFAVVQAALPTSNGATVDFTSASFGTPKGVIFFGGYGTSPGSVVSNAAFQIGFYDGTRQFSMAGASRNGQLTMDTGSAVDADSALITLDPTNQTKDGDCTASFITDGTRLTCADAAPSAYLTNALLIGGSGVSNVYTGQMTGNASQDGTTATTAPGFQPDVVCLFAHNNNTAHMRPSLGCAWNNGGSIVQRGMGYTDDNGGASGAVASILATNRIMQCAVSGAASLELTAFGANGFTLTTRDAGGARDVTYIAIKLNGLSAYLGTFASPTTVSTKALSGVGWTPQAGLMFGGEFAAVDTLYTSDNGELIGLGVFTASAAGTSSVYSEDGAADSITESITDNKVFRTRKDGADFHTVTASMTGDGVDFNYTTTNGTARQNAVLLFQSSATPSGSFGPLRRRHP